MHKLFNNQLSRIQRVLFIVAISCFSISITSCDGDEDKNETEITFPYKREGVIRLYADGKEFIFKDIIEQPFARVIPNVIGYDTIGRVYKGYPDPYSIIGIIQFTVLNDSLTLYSVGYNYPAADNKGAYEISNKEDDPFEYSINEYDDMIKGSFSGRLHHFAFDQEPMVIDSCFFAISKK